MARWTFTQGEDVYSFPINPKEMTSPLPTPKDGSSAAGVAAGSAAATLVRYDQPVEWSFGGFIRTLAQHDAMKAWEQRQGIVTVTDHLGRNFECFLSEFAATERKTNRVTPDRWQYTMKALVLRQSA
jgi:hypothetical protein